MRRLGLLSLALVAAACGPAAKPIAIQFHPTHSRAGIVNGTTDNGDPGVVAINYILDSYGNGATCTGELIGPHSVLTAGHCSALKMLLAEGGLPSTTQLCGDTSCLNSNGTPKSRYIAVFVSFGTDVNTAFTNNDVIQVSDMQANPNFCGINGSTNNCGSGDWDDIGLVKLNSTTMFSGKAEPALVPVNTDPSALSGAGYYEPSSVRYVGFGVTGYYPDGGAIPDEGTKREVTKNVAPNYSVSTLSAKEIEEDVQGVTGTDPGLTCSGDSGGPAFMSISGGEKIIAVTSRGDQNCQQAGIDTRVDPYVSSFINPTINGWGDPNVNSSTTGGTSGTTSSGTTTGSSTTGGTTGSSACATCENNSVASGGACSSQYSACTNDQACVTLSNCYNGCTTSSCYTQCQNTAGQTAVNELNAILDCFCYTACNTDCASDCGFGTGAECATCNSGSDCATGLCIGSAAPGECSGRVCTSNSDCNQAAGESCINYGNGVQACFYSGNVCPSSTSGTTSSGTTGSSTTSGTTTGNGTTTSGGPTGTTGGNTTTGGTTGGTTSTGGTSSGGTNTGNSGGNGGNSGGFGSTTTTGTTGGGVKSGGCGSTGAGELGFALFAVLPLLRRRRR